MTSRSKALWGLGLLWVTMMAGAQGRFIDPQDGYFDLSDHLLQQKGFMPVPIIITEPALDYGGGLGALWFSESLDEARHKREMAPWCRRALVVCLLSRAGMAVGGWWWLLYATG